MPPLPPGPSASASASVKSGGGVPPPPPQESGALVPVGSGQEEFSFNNVPPEYRREGTDWFAAFNPKIKKSLDITLVHSFGHTRWVVWCLLFYILISSFFLLTLTFFGGTDVTFYSVVCCVQFSQDGRYLATGCNQTAQIFDTKSGIKVW